MATFKIRAGQHIEGGRVYKKGQKVKSDLDLVKLFPEKFEIVSGQTEVDPEAQPAEDDTRRVGTPIKDIGLTKKAGAPEPGAPAAGEDEPEEEEPAPAKKKSKKKKPAWADDEEE